MSKIIYFIFPILILMSSCIQEELTLSRDELPMQINFSIDGDASTTNSSDANWNSAYASRTNSSDANSSDANWNFARTLNGKIKKNSDEDIRSLKEMENIVNWASAFIFESTSKSARCLMRFINCTAMEVSEKENTYAINVMLLRKELQNLIDSGKNYSIYIVANEDMTPFSKMNIENITLESIKKHVIHNSFSNFNKISYFTMYGLGDAIINKTEKIITSDVKLVRKAFKLSPFITSETLLKEIDSIEVKMDNGMRSACIDNEYFPKEEDYYSSPFIPMKKYAEGVDNIHKGIKYHYYMPIRLYSYPKTMDENYRRIYLKIKVTWKDGFESYFKTYVHKDNLRNNTWYKVYININTKGNTSTPIDLGASEVEVLDWSDIKDISGDLGDGRQEYLGPLNKRFEFSDEGKYVLRYKSSNKLGSTEIKDIYYNDMSFKNGSSNDVQKKRVPNEYIDKFKQCISIKQTPDLDKDDNGQPDYGYTGEIVLEMDREKALRLCGEQFFYTHKFFNLLLKTADESVGLETEVEIRLNPYIAISTLETDYRYVFVDGWNFPKSMLEKQNEEECYYQPGNLIDKVILGWIPSNVTRNLLTPYGYISRAYDEKYYLKWRYSPLNELNVVNKLVHINIYSLNNYNKHMKDVTLFEGNPRVRTGWTKDDLIQYGVKYGLSDESKSWTNIDKIKRTCQKINQFSTVAANSFIVSSLYGEVADPNIDNLEVIKVDFETAQKRAATYQEAGYRAGRWRLPTEAEMRIIAYIQSKEELRRIALDGKYIIEPHRWYFLADHRGAIYNDKDNKLYITDDVMIARGYCKVIYDSWIWGKEPESDITKYYPGD